MFNAKEVVSEVRLSNWQQYKEFYESVTYRLIEIKPIGDPNHVFVNCQISLNIDYSTLSVSEYVTLNSKISQL